MPIGAPKATSRQPIKMMPYAVYIALLIISFVQSVVGPAWSSNLFLGHHHILLLPALPLMYYISTSIHSTFQFVFKSSKWIGSHVSSMFKVASSSFPRVHLGLFLIASAICVVSGMPYQLISIGCFMYQLSVYLFYSRVVCIYCNLLI